jgi:hypothetical protein
MAFTTTRGIRVYERKDWAARPARGTSTAGRLFHAGIHHGGPVGPPRMTKAAAVSTIRGWQNYHMDSHGWNDIGYNLLVDGFGRLYEGRPVGVLAAGVGGHNTGGVHICFMQDGRYHKLNVAQRWTLKVLFEHGIPKLGLPPLKKFATNPRSDAGVFGHKEYSGHASNECPGNLILTHLKWRRSQYR